MTATNSPDAQPQGGGLPLDRETLLNNWPLLDVLGQLADWTEHLHRHHNCDCHGWEARSFLIPAARIYAANTRADLPRATAVEHELNLLLRRVSELTLDEGFSSHYQGGFEKFRDQMESVLKARLATPRPTGESGLTAALAELREMFPGKAVIIRREDSFYPPDCRDSAETNSMVTIKIGYLQSEPKFRSFRSLADCMAQVRAAAQGKVDESGDS